MNNNIIDVTTYNIQSIWVHGKTISWLNIWNFVNFGVFEHVEELLSTQFFSFCWNSMRHLAVIWALSSHQVTWSTTLHFCSHKNPLTIGHRIAATGALAFRRRKKKSLFLHSIRFYAIQAFQAQSLLHSMNTTKAFHIQWIRTKFHCENFKWLSLNVFSIEFFRIAQWKWWIW